MNNRVTPGTKGHKQSRTDEAIALAHRRLKEKMEQRDEVTVGVWWSPFYELSVDDNGDILIQDNRKYRAFYVSATGYIPETFPIPADGFQATDEEIRNLQCIETAADVIAVIDDILKHDM